MGFFVPKMLMPTAAASLLLYLSLIHIGMLGIVLAFLTPDSDNRSCQNLLLLKLCLSDMGHSYDIAAWFHMQLGFRNIPPPHGTLLLQEVVNYQTA